MGTPTIGFDLDMTLLDTSRGIVDTLNVLAVEENVRIDTDEVLADIGTPWGELIRRFFPDDRANHATERFRDLYLEYGLDHQTAMPGARDALEAVRRDGVHPVVVTARYDVTARACLAKAGFDVGDDVTGSVHGHEKGRVLKEHGAVAYVGDAIADVHGAHAADTYAVGVATGPATESELRTAGADAVLADLTTFVEWWRAWYPDHVESATRPGTS